MTPVMKELCSTENYTLVVAPSNFLKDTQDTPTSVYAIFNKQTGVREYSTAVLPEAYGALRGLQQALNEAIKEVETKDDISEEPKVTAIRRH